jgi:hypothetical protein
MKDLSFKLKTKAWPVVLEDDKGQELKFELRELKAARRDKYVDNLSGRLLTDKAGNVIGIKKYEGMQADLLVICMWTVPEDGEPKLVDKQTLDQWPGNVVKDLFEAAQVLNGFRKPDDENRILAEQIMKVLAEKGVSEVAQMDADDIEAIIENTKKKMFADAKEQTEAAG